jgi:acyl-CoA thioester hydrolase
LPFSTRIQVRGYEVDTQGHLNSAVYLQYAEHARWECLRAAGVSQDGLLASGVGPVQLEVSLKFFHELRGGDEIDVSCEHLWGDGKVFRLRQDYTRVDGELAATLTCVCGMLDLKDRRLVADPARPFRELSDVPSVLGL